MVSAEIFNRDSETAAVVDFFSSSNEQLLLITGESGCGKSAIVDKALQILVDKNLIATDSVLSYRFKEKLYANEGELFPQFLMDAYAALRPSWALDALLRSHGTYVDSWAVRLPSTTFNFKMANFKEPERAAPFFVRFSKDLAARYPVFRIENGENYQAEHNLRILKQLAEQERGPKLIVEVGTLTRDDCTIVRFLQHTCSIKRLKVSLFNEEKAHQYFHFVHEKEAPSTLWDISQGNALAIRHFGTALADLPVGDRVRRRLEGFSAEAMILLWCLAALRGASDVDLLEHVSRLGDKFHPTLITLRLADVVRFESDSEVKFAHSLFGTYFISEQFVYDVNRWGRKRIIEYLEGTTFKSVAAAHELARQYYAKRDFHAAGNWAGQAALESYRQQDFRTVVTLAELLDAWKDAPPQTKRHVNMLLLQTAVRTGDQTLAVDRLRRFDEGSDGTAILLQAQACYLMNRFEAGIELCGGVALHASDTFLLPRALGVRAACLIAVGRHEEAANDFAMAKTLAREMEDRELEMEILRLSPEVEPEPVWKLRYEEMMNSTLTDRYPYLHAKCLHNFGAFLAATSEGQNGMDQIVTAMNVFKAGNYPEYSYSAILLSAIMLLSGQFSEARDLLETSEIWCHEQYDTFGLKTNLGISYALEENWETALYFFTDAQRCLDDNEHPLFDPYFRFLSLHNLAIAKAGLGEFREALAILEATVVPLNAYDYAPKVKRRAEFIRLLRDYEIPTVVHLPDDAQRWATRACVMEPATLQFFDFNINVLPPTFTLT